MKQSELKKRFDPWGRVLEKAGVKEVAHSYLERRRRRQEKRARHKKYRRQLRQQAAEAAQAEETVQVTAAE